MNAKRWTCVALATAFAAVTNCALAQNWTGSGDMIWTQPDSNSFSAEYINGATATFTAAGAGIVTIDAGGVTPGAVVVNSTANYTFTGGSIGGAGSLTKMGSGYLNIANANSFSGGVFINAGTLRFEAGSTSAGLGDAGNVVTFTGNGSIYLTQVDLIFPQGIAVNGVSAVLSGNAGRDIAFNNALTGSGTLTLNAGGNPLNVNLNSTANTFSGNIRLTEYDCALTMNSLADSVGSQMVLGSSSKSKYANFTYGSGAIVPLVLNERQIVFGSGNGSIKISNNASGANTITINKDVINNGTGGNRTFTLGGSNTGNNTFAGAITNGSSYVTSLSKADAGTWILSGNNTYSGATTVSAGTLVLSGNNTYSGVTTISGGTLVANKIVDGGVASSIGQSSNSATSLVLSGGVLRYTGAGDSTDRSFNLSASSSIDASGTGPIAFTNTVTPAYGTVNTARALTLTGTSTDTNTLAAALANNGTGINTFNKAGIGTWVLRGANSFTGASSLSGGGTLVLDYSVNDNSKLSTGAFTVSLANGGGGGTLILSGGSHTQVVASTSLANGTGLWITRTSGSSSLQLNAITRANGQNAMSLSEDSIASIDQTNGNGILGGWATVSNNWAVNSINGADGAIIGLTSYTTTVPTTGGDTAANYQLTGSHELTGNLTGNSLRIVNDADSDVLAMGDVGSRTLTPGSGHSAGILYVGGYDNNYTITGAGTVRSATANNTLNVNVYTGTLTVNALLNSGTAATVKYGAGTLVVGGNNVATGPFWVLDGTVRLTHNNAAGTTAGAVGVQNGAALELANSVAIGAEALTIVGTGVSNGGALRNVAGNTSTYGGTITIGAGGARINSDSGAILTISAVVTALFQDATIGGIGTTTVSGVISGAGNLIKVDSGTVTLLGANTYSGETVINDGKLALGGHNVLNGKRMTLNGGTLDAGTYTNTLSTLKVSGSGAIAMSPGAVLAFADSRAIAWGGTLNITGAFTAGTSLRFGTSSAALTSTQIASLKATGYTLSLDANGYLTGKPSGTIISFQ